MTVILGKERQIGNFFSPFIGETTFLREYYNDSSIISWSHYSAYDINLWENSRILLNETYVDNMQKTFPFIKEIQEINYREIAYKKVSYHTSFHPNYTGQEKELFNVWLKNTIQSIPRNRVITKIGIQLHTRMSEFVILPNVEFYDSNTGTIRIIKFLPRKFVKTNNCIKVLNFDNYIIQGNDCSGNSIFSAIDKCLKDINRIKIPNEETVSPPLLSDSKFISILNSFKLRRKLKEYGANYSFNKNFLDLLGQDGFWDNGINGDMGLKILGLIAKIIKKTILIIVQNSNEKFQCYLFETIEDIYDLKKHKIITDEIEGVLNTYPNAIKLYYNGYYYRAIVRTN